MWQLGASYLSHIQQVWLCMTEFLIILVAKHQPISRFWLIGRFDSLPVLGVDRITIYKQYSSSALIFAILTTWASLF